MANNTLPTQISLLLLVILASTYARAESRRCVCYSGPHLGKETCQSSAKDCDHECSIGSDTIVSSIWDGDCSKPADETSAEDHPPVCLSKEQESALEKQESIKVYRANTTKILYKNQGEVLRIEPPKAEKIVGSSCIAWREGGKNNNAHCEYEKDCDSVGWVQFDGYFNNSYIASVYFRNWGDPGKEAELVVYTKPRK